MLRECQLRTWNVATVKYGTVYCIPHHGVYHPRKAQLRVVFDCGATFQGMSLNTQLLQGPDLTSSLIGVVTRFRKEQVVIMADIEAMFHQVRVPKDDADLLRFLWWPDGDLTQNMVEYRMVVHLFGATSSPSCANFALRRCTQDNKYFIEEVTEAILHSFYVDDCLLSVNSEDKAVSLYHDLVAICAKGGFTLTKWIRNNRDILAKILEEFRAKNIKDLDLDHDLFPVERVLGVQWCIQSDAFMFKIVLQQRPLTKSSIYDPLGILSPVILYAKKILQDLCRKKLGWDDLIPALSAQEWISWLNGLHDLENFKNDRCFKPVGFGEMSTAQLHHFSDASEDGYGVVTYLLLHDVGLQVHIAFVMGKSRVAPLKPVSIPHMELTAATLASRMDSLLRTELSMHLQDSVFWTDSTSLLKYIKNEVSRYRIIVANRVSEILKVSQPSQWRYVNTALKPADIASRGLKVESFLKNKDWVFGPQFLSFPEQEWPVNLTDLGECSSDDPEVKRSITANAAQVEEDMDVLMQFIQYFSSWTLLKRSVAWILRFKQLLINLSQKRKSLRMSLTQTNMDETQQKQQLKEEMEEIKNVVKPSFLWRS
ncbi:uncharacterized protein LOC117805176 [Tachysurus ichikawai]